MRRTDREVQDLTQIKEIISQADVLRVVMNNGTYPYILLVNFGFEMNDSNLVLYFHSSKEGEKHKVIQQDNHVSFEVDCGHQLIPPLGEEVCMTSYAYRSVIGQGVIEKVSDAEKAQCLHYIVNQYGIRGKVFNPNHLANTVVYKIIVKSYTAKQRRVEH